MHNVSFSLLDKILIKEGLAKCHEFFRDCIRQSNTMSLKLINDTRITFPCFYILMPILEEANMFNSLKSRLQEAFDFAQNILNHRQNSPVDSLKNKTLLKWIFDTSFNRVFLDRNFNEVIDVTVSILINEYSDVTIINKIANLIFLRNRQGENIHELVWCFFKTNNLLTVKLIALRLKAKNAIDIKLARKLLNYKVGSYNNFISWLNNNEPYIYLTDESFQYSSNPVLFRTDFSSKYLCKNKKTNNFSNEEKNILDKFNELEEEEKNILSEYSNVLSKANNQTWNEFMKNSIAVQLQMAKDGVHL